ncbi:MAG: dUTP diphosphatase [Gammaproteobacteria bacterium]|nr:dUTP diphosphatase [Gammaproteobacteria bacterium]
MLEMQDSMNRRVDQDWVEREREWYRAVWIECAELMDHYGGWKWWKHSEPDYEQVILEIVDIWHFGLSMMIVESPDYDAAAERLVQEWEQDFVSGGFLPDVECLAADALERRRFNVRSVRSLLELIDRDFDDLYRAYIGKNVLNFFRQDNGYREGHYRKQWQGREDNEHLVDIVSALDADDAGFRDAIYADLERRYADGASGPSG